MVETREEHGGVGMAGRHGHYHVLEHTDVRGVGVAWSISVGHRGYDTCPLSAGACRSIGKKEI
jgi:hypothetical protein